MAEAAPPTDGNLVVVVRAPNQETQDFEVACPATWSVLKLKEHLQENYNGNPIPVDQKLIYSGQLLEDEAVLRDVLRHEGVSPSRHTVHLVCRPPKGVPEARRTRVEPASDVARGSSPPNPVASFTPEFSIHQSTSGDQPNEIRYRIPTIQYDMASNSVTYSAHILAMQNMYAQYYQQLLLHHQAALSGRTSPSGASYVFNPCRFTLAAMGPEQQLQYWQNAQIPLLNQQNFTVTEANNDNNNNNHNFNANNNNLNNINNANNNNNIHNNNNNNIHNNNNNIHNNNNNNNNNLNNNMDEDDNIREWEDYIYLAARVALLAMLVYFYSSVEKLILVSGLGLLFFIYQQLRANLQEQGNAAAAAAAAANAANPAAGNAAPPMAGDHGVNQQPAARNRDEIDRLQAAMDGENAPPPGSAAASGVMAPHAVAQQSPVAAAANLLRAFFVSLIP